MLEQLSQLTNTRAALKSVLLELRGLLPANVAPLAAVLVSRIGQSIDNCSDDEIEEFAKAIIRVGKYIENSYQTDREGSASR